MIFAIAAREKIATQRLVDQFIDMVKIASPSRQEGAFAAYMRKELEALGFSVEVDSAGDYRQPHCHAKGNQRGGAAHVLLVKAGGLHNALKIANFAE